MVNERVDTLVVLGADGDLAGRLLLPGLAALLGSDWDPRRTPKLLAAGLSELDEDAWQRRVGEAFASGGSGRRVDAVARASRYRTVDVTSVDQLAALLAECEGRPAIYFALPPAVAARACHALRVAELPEGTVLALEKPFGVDSHEDAKALNALLATLVPEEQVFRIDHFLGRSDVLNILGTRFANRILEPVWNNQHVASIEVVYDETLGLEGRAGYYDKAGALVDMLQSHLLQVMALLMMDPVSRIDQRELRDAKGAGPPRDAAVRRPARRPRAAPATPRGRSRAASSRRTAGSRGSTRRATPRRWPSCTSRWQSWRWAGVPVTLRSGKALGSPRKEAVVTFKPTPHLPEGLVGHDTPDSVTIGFKPARLSLHLDVSGPGDPFDLDSAVAAADLDDGDLPAYGEVLAGVLDGDPLLAVRGDNAEECWRIVEPVAGRVATTTVPLETYAAGSDGPRSWRRPAD